FRTKARMLLLEVEVDAEHGSATYTGVDAEVAGLVARVHLGRGNRAVGTVPSFRGSRTVSLAAHVQAPSIFAAEGNLRSAEPFDAGKCVQADAKGPTVLHFGVPANWVVIRQRITVLIGGLAATEAYVEHGTVHAHHAGAAHALLQAYAQINVHVADLGHVLGHIGGIICRICSGHFGSGLLGTEANANLTPIGGVGIDELLPTDDHVIVQPGEAIADVVALVTVEQVTSVVQQWVRAKSEAPVAVLREPVLTAVAGDLARLCAYGRYGDERCGEKYSLLHDFVWFSCALV